MTASRIFFDPLIHWQDAHRLLDTARAVHGAAFATRADHDLYFSTLVTPKSLRWVLKDNAKTGSTSLRAFLYWMEFGHPLTAHVHDPSHLNSDTAAHHLTQHHVFRYLHWRGDVTSIPPALDGALRLCLVRHPADRTTSAFRYFCRSNSRGVMEFAEDRSRISALTGFDWLRDPGTVDGMLRFLDYVAICLDHEGEGMLTNHHFRPQWLCLRPDVFRPQLIGRLEHLGDFFAAIASHLGSDPAVARAIADRRLNPGEQDGRRPADTAAVRTRLRQVYARDYQEFGYDD